MKFSIFAAESSEEPRFLRGGEVTGIESAAARMVTQADGGEAGAKKSTPVKAETPEQAMHLVLDRVCGTEWPAIDAVGYRVVHPGATLTDHQRITPVVMQALEAAAVFAPLHDPAVIPVIRAGMERFPQLKHFACFDTVFHRTMPEEATMYALPPEYRSEGLRRYGFHGLSCESVVRQMRAQAGGVCPQRMVIAHLGSGCSVTALLEGKSVDTSMGLTPTGGVVMGTRPGDLDPGVLLYLLRQQAGEKDAAIAALERMVNHASGVVALSGLANDMRAVRAAAKAGDRRSLLALKVFTRSVRKAIGSYGWLLGGLEAVVFTGGIGEHDAATRAEVLEELHDVGVAVDPARNEGKADEFRRINTDGSRAAVYVVQAKEDLVIAEHVQGMAQADQ